MKINELLNEGLIQVPEHILQKFAGIAISAAVSKLVALDPKMKKIVHEETEEYLDRYVIQIKDLSEFIGKVTTTSISKNAVKYKKGNRLTFVHMDVEDEPSQPPAYIEQQDGKIFLVFNLAKFNLEQNLGTYQRNPSAIHNLVHAIVGNIEHELTHIIQKTHLQHVDKGMDIDEPDYYNQDGSLDHDKYQASKIEFDPLIKTAIGALSGFIKTHQNHGGVVDAGLISEVIKSFTDPDYKSNAKIRWINGQLMPVSAVRKLAHNYFGDWKAKDQLKWRKAVKYLTRRLIHEFLDKPQRPRD